MNMKVGIIGCGNMGNLYAEELSAMRQVELAAVCDSDMESAWRLAVKHGVQAYEIPEAMLAAELDVVCITLPSHLHKSCTLLAAEYGKHVICEKPIALELADARDMISACEKAGVRLFIGHVVRFFPEYEHMKKEIDEGSIGAVGMAHAKRIGPHPAAAKSWFGDPARSGGVIKDLMIHDIDYMRSVLGEIRSVYAVNKRTGTTDYALATLRFQSGTIVNLEAHWGYPGPFTTAVEFAGKRGIIRSNNQTTQSVRLYRGAEYTADAQGIAIPISPSHTSPYYRELEHFLESIASGVEPIVNAHDAYKALEIAEAVLQSAQSGLPVHLTGMSLRTGGES